MSGYPQWDLNKFKNRGYNEDNDKQLVMKRPTPYFLLILLIALLAIFFRFWKIGEIPPGLYPDVAINGNDALGALSSGDFKPFYPENNGREGFFINIIALVFWLFGTSVFVLKIIPAFFGALTVIGIYFLAKELFKENGTAKAEFLGLAASFFLAISLWHNIFSRITFRAILAPLLLTWSFYFLLKSLKSQRALNGSIFASLSGILVGLGFQTYIAFRMTPFVFVPIFIFALAKSWPKIKAAGGAGWFKKIYIAEGFWKWDVLFIFIILAFLPLGIYYFEHPADFMGRTSQVSVFSTQNPLKELALSAIKTLGQFNFVGDYNWRHNLSGSPQLFWPVGILFLIGIIYSLRQIFYKRYYQNKKYDVLAAHWTLLVWWGAMLMPSILTTEGVPHALRSITAIIPTYIFAALGLERIYQRLKEKINQKSLFILILIFAVIIAISEGWRLFISWGSNPELKYAFTQKFVEQGEFLKNAPPQIKKYMVVNESGVPVPYPDGIPMPAQTIMFVASDVPNVTYLKKDEIFSLAPSALLNSQIILMSDDAKILEFINQNYQLVTVHYFDGWALIAICNR